jgi:hypothetical protein
VLEPSEGQAHDGYSAADMLDRLGDGKILLADRACDSDALHAMLSNRARGSMSSRCHTA